MKRLNTVAVKWAPETQQTSQEKRRKEKCTKLNELFKTVGKQCNVTENLISVVVKLGFSVVHHQLTFITQGQGCPVKFHGSLIDKLFFLYNTCHCQQVKHMI